jgi:hypothetical protein
MKFRYGISFLLLILLSFWNCSRIKKGPSQTTDEHQSEGSSIASTEDISPPRDSITQSYFSDEYSIHIIATVTNPDPILFPEYMLMIVYNSNGRTNMPPGATWHPDLVHGLKPLEPEWPDYFLVHVYNLGNCCTCTADYLLKITADEIKIIGKVNDYKDGKFYVNICYWPPMKSHGQMTLTKHEVPLINDTLHYPENYNY